MKHKKAVILVVVLLFIVPFVFSDAGEPCDTEGEILDNNICDEGVWEPPNDGIKYRVNTTTDKYDVVYSMYTGWHACNADISDSPLAGPSLLSNGEIIEIDDHGYICHFDQAIEKISKCENTNLGNRVLVDNTYYYCTSANNWDAHITDIDACTKAEELFGGISWTGRLCCGEEFEPDYYNDLLGMEGGCWHSSMISSGQLVSDANLAPNPDFVDSYTDQGDSIPLGWERVNKQDGGYSYLSDRIYEISITQPEDKLFGLKSNKIKVRANTEYNLSINVILYGGEFRALNVECDTPISWTYTPTPRTITIPSGWQVVYALFKTSTTTKECQIFPTFTEGKTGTVQFNNIKLFENNPYVLNDAGEFFSCGKTDFGSAEANAVVTNIGDVCTAKGDYYCSGSKWVYNPAATGFESSRITPGANLLINPLFEIR